MDAAGLPHAGMARSAHEANQSTIVTVHGLRVAHLGGVGRRRRAPRPVSGHGLPAGEAAPRM